mgnify:CR=1 FL=1
MEGALSAAFLEDINKWLSLSNNVYGGFWTGIQYAYMFVQAIGFGLMAAFFLKALLQESTKDNLTVETLGKLMIGLIISLTVITHIPDITNAFLRIAENASGYVLTDMKRDMDTAPGQDSAGVIGEAINAWYAKTPKLLAFFQALVFFVIHQVCVIAFDFAIVSRAIDIGWRVAIAPISCADMFEGANSPGVRHLKSIFGSALVALLLAVIAQAGTLLVGGLLSGTDDGTIFMAIACQVALAGAAVGANQKAREIL